MSNDLAQYREFELRLWMARWQHEGEESVEEDEILDQMEGSWLKLTEDERAVLRLEGPRCWPTDSSSWPPRLAGTIHPSAPTSWTYQGFRSPAEAILSEDAA